MEKMPQSTFEQHASTEMSDARMLAPSTRRAPDLGYELVREFRRAHDLNAGSSHPPSPAPVLDAGRIGGTEHVSRGLREARLLLRGRLWRTLGRCGGLGYRQRGESRMHAHVLEQLC